MPVWLIVLEVALGLVVAAFLIHTFASWADSKGWIRYQPRREGRGVSSGSAQGGSTEPEPNFGLEEPEEWRDGEPEGTGPS